MKVKIVRYFNESIMEWIPIGIFSINDSDDYIRRQWYKFRKGTKKKFKIKIVIEERYCSETSLEEMKGFISL